MNHTLTCCSNGGARKAVWQTRVRHGNNDESHTLFGRTRDELTFLTDVPVNVEVLSLCVCLLFVGLGGRGW